MHDRKYYIELTLQNLFGDRFQRVEGNWYLINEQTIVRVCYSKAFLRSSYTRYFFGVQQSKFNEYKSKGVGILFVCGGFGKAFLLPGPLLDEILEGVPVARDGSWKFDIHHRDNRFDLKVTKKQRVDISSYHCQPIEDTLLEPTKDPILLDERVQW